MGARDKSVGLACTLFPLCARTEARWGQLVNNYTRSWLLLEVNFSGQWAEWSLRWCLPEFFRNGISILNFHDMKAHNRAMVNRHSVSFVAQKVKDVESAEKRPWMPMIHQRIRTLRQIFTTLTPQSSNHTGSICWIWVYSNEQLSITRHYESVRPTTAWGLTPAIHISKGLTTKAGKNSRRSIKKAGNPTET